MIICMVIKSLISKVIRGKEKTNINKLIMIDCAANILTVMVHTFNQSPLIKLRLFSKHQFSKFSIANIFIIMVHVCSHIQPLLKLRLHPMHHQKNMFQHKQKNTEIHA